MDLTFWQEWKTACKLNAAEVCSKNSFEDTDEVDVAATITDYIVAIRTYTLLLFWFQLSMGLL